MPRLYSAGIGAQGFHESAGACFMSSPPEERSALPGDSILDSGQSSFDVLARHLVISPGQLFPPFGVFLSLVGEHEVVEVSEHPKALEDGNPPGPFVGIG